MANKFTSKTIQGTQSIDTVVITDGTGYDNASETLTLVLSDNLGLDEVLDTTSVVFDGDGTLSGSVTVTDGGYGFTGLPTGVLTGGTSGAFDAAVAIAMTGGVLKDITTELYDNTLGTLGTVIIGLSVANQLPTTAILISIIIEKYNGGSPYKNVFVRDVVIPGGTTLEIMEGNKINLDDQDRLLIRCSEDYAFNAVTSIMEIS